RRRSPPAPQSDHPTHYRHQRTGDSWSHAKDSESETASFVKQFRDQHADRHVVAQAGTEDDTENDDDVEHRQAVNEAESKKTEGAHDETDKEHSLAASGVGQDTFDGTQNAGPVPPQRERPRDCRPAPAELPLEG